MSAMTGLDQLNDDALSTLADRVYLGDPFTDEDYEAVFDEMERRGFFADD